MDDPVAALLEELAEYRLRELLLSLEPTDVVAADNEVARSLERLRPADAGWRVLTLDAALESPRDRCFVWTSGGERAWVERLRRRHPGAEVFGMFGDVLPRRAAGRRPDHRLREPEAGYVLLCIPRSGSYHLCGLLTNLGLGRPDEHVDGGLCAAARRGLLDLHDWFETIAQAAVENGWFGTKLISHVLFEAFESGFPPNDFVDWVQRRRLRVVHLHRNDVAAQAVSNFFARRTGVWTLTGELETPTRPPYDFDEILADWHFLRQQDAWLRQLLQLLPPAHRVDYEQLDARPAAMLAHLVSHLKGRSVPESELDLRPRTRKQRDALSAEYVQRFRADLERWDRDASDLG